jgi:hypothetical protein
LPGLPEEANAVEVRLVKGNSLVASQRIDKPEGGQWCGVEQATLVNPGTRYRYPRPSAPKAFPLVCRWGGFFSRPSGGG